MAVEPLLFDLRYRKECYEIKAGQKPRRLSDRDRTLPDEPTWFQPMRGNHGPVHEKATKLNEAQTRSGYLDYFFFPEVAEMSKAS